MRDQGQEQSSYRDLITLVDPKSPKFVLTTEPRTRKNETVSRITISGVRPKV